MEPLWHIELLIFFLTFASNSHLEKGLLLVLFQLDSELYTILTANTAEATDSSLFFFFFFLFSFFFKLSDDSDHLFIVAVNAR